MPIPNMGIRTDFNSVIDELAKAGDIATMKEIESDPEFSQDEIAYVKEKLNLLMN